MSKGREDKYLDTASSPQVNPGLGEGVSSVPGYYDAAVYPAQHQPQENEHSNHNQQQQQQERQIIYPPIKKRGLLDTYLLWIGLGLLGAHHLYLGRRRFALVYLVTFGLCGIGWIVDFFRLPCLVKEANKRIDTTQPPRTSLFDAYLLWFPLGFLGLHHFYLKRWMWGIVYVYTCGLFGIGWLIDGFRMKWLVEEANADRIDRPIKKKVCDAYLLTVFPLTGLLGVQHYYLNRTSFGVRYSLTFGFLGVGWILDIFRMPFLVKEANHKMLAGDDGKVRLDDCYVLLFPLGFLGLHHFYLKRYLWGIIYFLTYGIFGIGWIVDFFRLPWLVKSFNQNVDELLINSGNSVIEEEPQNIGHNNTGHTPDPTAVGAATDVGAVGGVNPAQVPPYSVQGYPPQVVYPGYTGHIPPQNTVGYPAPQGRYPQVYAVDPTHMPPANPDNLVTVPPIDGDYPPSYNQAMAESKKD